MKTHVLDLRLFHLTLPESWSELEADAYDSESPLTIANAETGVGALQISVAKFMSGKMPQLSLACLAELLDNFAESRRLVISFDQQTLSNDKLLIGRSFQSEGDFIRVWYASNGKDIVLVTYICEWGVKDEEENERELIVNSLRFHDAASVS